MLWSACNSGVENCGVFLILTMVHQKDQIKYLDQKYLFLSLVELYKEGKRRQFLNQDNI